MATFAMLGSCVVGSTLVTMSVMRVGVSLNGALVSLMRRRVSLFGTWIARHQSNGSPLQREGCYQKPEQVTDEYAHKT